MTLNVNNPLEVRVKNYILSCTCTNTYTHVGSKVTSYDGADNDIKQGLFKARAAFKIGNQVNSPAGQN